MKTCKYTRLNKKHKGFTLIEALVAFLVLSIGSLAFTKVQTVLRHNADVSKQRSEAVRLATEKIEDLRAFTFINTASRDYFDATTLGKIGPVVIYDDLTDSTETLSNTTYNTEYTRNVKITDRGTYKVAYVTVAWTDRYGDAQVVQLTTAIARTAPSMLGQAMLTPVPLPLRNPLNRNLKIPVSAVDLGNGKSGFIPPGNNTQYYVFSNTDATVFQLCTLSSPTTTLTVAEYEAYGSTKCVAAPGYFISGSISFDLTTKISLLDSGGKRPADPPTSVCEYYNAASSLITGTIANGPTGSNTLLAANGVTYYALNVLIGTPTPISGASCVPIMSTFSVPVSTDKASNSNKLSSVTVNTYTATATVAGSTTPVSGVWSTNITDAGAGKATLTFTPTGSKFPVGATVDIKIPVGSVVFSNSSNKWTPDSNSAAIAVQFDTRGAAPVLVSTTPATGTTLSDVNQNIVLSFDQAVAAGTGVITLNRFTNPSKTASKPVETFSLPGSAYVSFNGTQVTIDPMAPLDKGSSYFISMDNTAIKSVGSCAVNFGGITDSSTLGFSTAAGTATTCPTDPKPFIGLTMSGLTSTPTGSSITCYSDALTMAKDSTKHYISYFCVVLQTGTDTTATFKWSGSLNLQGPSNWLASSNYRVCRYTNPNGDSMITSNEHPNPYTDVTESLSDQNFLVVKNSESCPSQILNVTKDVAIYYTTVSHQP